MATVATVSIKLDAQTAALRKGFQESSQATKQLGTQLRQSLGSGIVKLNQGLQALRTGLGAVTSAFNSMRAAVDEVADIGDFADRIDISVEALQGLQRTAEQLGGRAEVLNTALQRLQRRISDAARSGGPLADRLSEMGMSVQELNMLSPDQQFLRMADAIKELNNVGDQNSLIMAAMDTEGIELRNTLVQGSDALREMSDELREYASVSEETVRKAQELSGQMKEMEGVWKAQKVEIMSSFLPAMESAGDMLKGFAMGYENFLYQVRNPLEALTDPVASVENWLKSREPMDVLEGFDERQAELKKVQAEQEAYAAKLAAQFKEGRDAVKDMRKDAEKINRLAPQMLKTPNVGAVTSTTVGGFSALHDARKRWNDRERHEKAVEEYLAEIRDLTRDRPEAVPVSIITP